MVSFSPLADEAPPQSCDCCWLPGGYPELHAAALSAAHRFRAGLAQFAQARPVHGECGGYMVLGEGLEDGNGVRHPMTGLLGHCTSFAKRKLHPGYREARLFRDGPLGPAGAMSAAVFFMLSRRHDAFVRDLSFIEGGHAGMAGERGAKQKHRDRGA